MVSNKNNKDINKNCKNDNNIMIVIIFYNKTLFANLATHNSGFLFLFSL